MMLDWKLLGTLLLCLCLGGVLGQRLCIWGGEKQAALRRRGELDA